MQRCSELESATLMWELLRERGAADIGWPVIVQRVNCKQRFSIELGEMRSHQYSLNFPFSSLSLSSARANSFNDFIIVRSFVGQQSILLLFSIRFCSHCILCSAGGATRMVVIGQLDSCIAHKCTWDTRRPVASRRIRSGAARHTVNGAFRKEYLCSWKYNFARELNYRHEDCCNGEHVKSVATRLDERARSLNVSHRFFFSLFLCLLFYIFIYFLRPASRAKADSTAAFYIVCHSVQFIRWCLHLGYLWSRDDGVRWP